MMDAPSPPCLPGGFAQGELEVFSHPSGLLGARQPHSTSRDIEVTADLLQRVGRRAAPQEILQAGYLGSDNSRKRLF